jgi:hypothetical protein
MMKRLREKAKNFKFKKKGKRESTEGIGDSKKDEDLPFERRTSQDAPLGEVRFLFCYFSKELPKLDLETLEQGTKEEILEYIGEYYNEYVKIRELFLGIQFFCNVDEIVMNFLLSRAIF